MFADVILHRRVPPQFEVVTYRVPSSINLRVGQLVQVPFGKQVLAAYVKKLHNEAPRYPTKEVVAAAETHLTALQQALAQLMSVHYQCSLSKIIDYFIPEQIWPKNTQRKKNAPKKNDEQMSILAAPVLDEDEQLDDVIKKITGENKNTLLLEISRLPHELLYKKIIQQLATDQQALFLFPEIGAIPKALPAGSAVFHSELSEGDKARIWKGVLSGEVQSIFGTRAALFLPFQKLAFINVLQEENQSYLEQRMPRYHALDVAETLARLFKATLLITSSFPRVETWHGAHIGRYRLEQWKSSRPSLQPAHLTLYDMAEERQKGAGFFAFGVIEKTAHILAEKGQVLFFIQRRGKAGAIFCRDCQRVLRCKQCRGPFAVHGTQQDEGALQGAVEGQQKGGVANFEMLHCHRCKITTPLPFSCPFCHGQELKTLGIGTEKLLTEVKKIFSKATCLRIDSDSTKGGLHKKISIEELNSADILVATQVIDKPLRLDRLKFTVIFYPENLLNLPDFRAAEKTAQLITHLRHMTAGGEMAIQTLLKEHPLWARLQKNETWKIYEEEMAVRRSLSLPPFHEIIRGVSF